MSDDIDVSECCPVGQLQIRITVLEKALEISNKELAKYVYSSDGQNKKYIQNLICFAVEQAEKEIENDSA